MPSGRVSCWLPLAPRRGSFLSTGNLPPAPAPRVPLLADPELSAPAPRRHVRDRRRLRDAPVGEAAGLQLRDDRGFAAEDGERNRARRGVVEPFFLRLLLSVTEP
jgi:hypothetical protein